MKFAALLVLCLLDLSGASLESEHRHPTRAEVVGEAIADILETSFARKSIVFDVVVFGDAQRCSLDAVVAAVARRNGGSYASELQHVRAPDAWHFRLNRSALILTADAGHFDLLQRRVRLANDFPKPLHFLVYVADARDLFDLLELPDLMYNRVGVFIDFVHFVVERERTVELVTLEYFGRVCNQPQFVTANVFDGRWRRRPPLLTRQRDFHGCVLVAGGAHNFPVLFYRDALAGGRLRGLIVDIFGAMAQLGNFTPAYVPYRADGVQRVFPASRNPVVLDHEQTQVVLEVKTPMVGSLHTSPTFQQSQFVFVVTPSEPYGIYEKMLMVFDATTWTLLLVTFACAFTTIFAVNRLPRRLQSVVYGEGVSTPYMNILHIFFGIGQMRVPRRAFARALLILFIFFCLIFRTCYQSILYEFMTSDMRPPAPQTVDDLFVRNFSVVTVGSDHSRAVRHLLDMIERRRRPNIAVLRSPAAFVRFFRRHHDDHSRRLAFFMPDDTLAELAAICRCRPRVLVAPLFTLHCGVAVYRNHFLRDLVDDVVRRLTPAGILQHSFEFYMWVHNRPPFGDGDAAESKRPPQVFCVADLSFGFVLWLAACGVSACGFFLELVAFTVRRRARSLAGLALFLLLLFERMQHYSM